MHQFSGSVFFTQERNKDISTCVSKHLSIPLFIRRRITSNSARKRLDKDHIFKKITNDKLADEVPKKVDFKDEKQKEPTKCIKTKPFREIILADTERKMPPNLYNPQEPAKSREGRKGAYWSIIPRNGHAGNVSVDEKHELKEEPRLPTATYNSKCTKHVGRFKGDPKSRRPSERFMVMDPGLCWRDPNTPGPLHYYPKNYTLEQSVSKPVKSTPPQIWKYLPNSIVPDRMLSVQTPPDPIVAGPGRYNPYEPACTCHRKDVYSTDLAWQIFGEKVKKFRGYHVKPIHRDYCEHPHGRNIKGHGHTSIFRSKTVRIVQKSDHSNMVDVVAKPFRTNLSRKYLYTLRHPRRTPISIRGVFESRLLRRHPHILFNTTYRPQKKKPSHIRANIAFMSGVARFPDQKHFYRLGPAMRFDRKLHYGQGNGQSHVGHGFTRSYFPAHVAYGKKASCEYSERLSRIPARFIVQKIKQRERVFTFNRLPKPENLFTHTGDVSMTFRKIIRNDSDIQKFFKDDRVAKKFEAFF